MYCYKRSQYRIFLSPPTYFILAQFSLDVQLCLVSLIQRCFKLWIFQGGSHPLRSNNASSSSLIGSK